MALGWGQDNYDGGWVNDPVAIAECAKANAFLEWGATEAASLDMADIPNELMACEIERKVLGKLRPEIEQGAAGFCCGAGTANAAESTLIAQIAAGESYEYKPLAFEVIYAGGRYDAGYSWMGDGSTGAASAAFVKAKGAPPRAQYGAVDLNKYQVDLARGWARRGLPPEVLAAAKQYPVQEIARIKTWAEAKQAMAQGHFILVASNFGFKMTRDAEGVLTASGVWKHCMSVTGFTRRIRDTDHGYLLNSWPQSGPFSGPDGPFKQGNSGGFVHWKTLEAMFAQGDSYALVGLKGAPLSRKLLKWF